MSVHTEPVNLHALICSSLQWKLVARAYNSQVAVCHNSECTKELLSWRKLQTDTVGNLERQLKLQGTELPLLCVNLSPLLSSFSPSGASHEPDLQKHTKLLKQTRHLSVSPYLHINSNCIPALRGK